MSERPEPRCSLDRTRFWLWFAGGLILTGLSGALVRHLIASDVLATVLSFGIAGALGVVVGRQTL